LVHGKPVIGHFAIQVPVPDSGTFQLHPERFRAAICHEVLHRQVDEAAALAWPSHAVNGLDCGFRQNNVDAFAHGMRLMIFIHIIYTSSMYVK